MRNDLDQVWPCLPLPEDLAAGRFIWYAYDHEKLPWLGLGKVHTVQLDRSACEVAPYHSKAETNDKRLKGLWQAGTKKATVEVGFFQVLVVTKTTPLTKGGCIKQENVQAITTGMQGSFYFRDPTRSDAS